MNDNNFNNMDGNDQPVMPYKATGNLNTALNNPQMTVGRVTDVNIQNGPNAIDNTMKIGGEKVLTPEIPVTTENIDVINTKVENVDATGALISETPQVSDDRLQVQEAPVPTIPTVAPETVKSPYETGAQPSKKKVALSGDAQVAILIVIIIFVFILVLPIVTEFIKNSLNK